MRMKPRLLAASIAAACALGAVPLTAAAANIYVQVEPPAPRHEVVPAPRHGYVWAPGYWDWRHGKYHWVAGHWERERPGMSWHAARWEKHGNRWEMVKGGWSRERDGKRFVQRDRDHDGVPNREDPAPNNPRVR